MQNLLRWLLCGLMTTRAAHPHRIGTEGFLEELQQHSSDAMYLLSSRRLDAQEIVVSGEKLH